MYVCMYDGLISEELLRPMSTVETPVSFAERMKHQQLVEAQKTLHD